MERKENNRERILEMEIDEREKIKRVSKRGRTERTQERERKRERERERVGGAE